MASLKEIKGRIASIQSTQKITSAMRMVASAKLHRVQGVTEKFLYYKDHLLSILESLGGRTQPLPSPSGAAVLLIPVSSNSGLCGAFNSNLAKATFRRIGELQAEGARVHLMPIGKKIAHEVKKAHPDCDLRFVALAEQVEKTGGYAEVPQLAEHLLRQKQAASIDRVEFVYHHFKSMGSQVITTTPLTLECPTPPAKQEEVFLTEPSPEELLRTLFPRLLNAQVYGILLDSLTSEHAARMMAMQTADDNANDLLRELTLLYNKTRQQSITNELIDIMGGRTEK